MSAAGYLDPMKRGMVGGAYRGPVGLGRQRRTIRFVQVLLVVTAAGLLMFAGYSLGRTRGFDEGRQEGNLGAPKPPAVAQTFVIGFLGLVALGAALVLQVEGGVRLLTPARLLELEKAGELEPIQMDPAEETATAEDPDEVRAGPS